MVTFDVSRRLGSVGVTDTALCQVPGDQVMRNLTLLFLLFSFCAQSSEQSVLTDLSSMK
jgi:hypothetical protein